MAEVKKSYPRATLRKIIKGHTRKNLSKTVDQLVYLDYVAFMEELMKNAERKSKETGGKRIAAKDVRKVTLTSLRKFKG